VDITGVLTSTGGGTSVRNTLAGGLPYGEVALPAAMEAVRAGEELLFVNAGVMSVADIGWTAKAGSTLTGVEALKGKKVSYTRPGSVTDMIIRMVLSEAGIKQSDVNLIAAGGLGANLTAVLQGAVDVGLIAEPLWSQNKEKLHPVFWVKDVIDPNITQTVGIVTPEFAKENPDKIRAIIKGRMRGVQFVMEHTDEAADITAKAYNMDPALFRAAFKNFASFGYWGDGRFDRKGMERMAEGMRLVGKLDGKFDWDKVVTEEFLPTELQTN
jgi:NitT/TauT family transport system substrate-binding protein